MIFVTLTQKPLDSIVVQSKCVYGILSRLSMFNWKSTWRNFIGIQLWTCNRLTYHTFKVNSDLFVAQPIQSYHQNVWLKTISPPSKKNEQKQKQPTSSKYNKKNWKTTIQNSLKLEKVLTGRPKYRSVGRCVVDKLQGHKNSKYCFLWFAFLNRHSQWFIACKNDVLERDVSRFMWPLVFFCVEFYT